MTERVRLHISPFTPALLRAIIPASILPSATNISYHEIQTFPEKNYGFVELPIMDAEKIKKKLNGSILKGSKVKIAEAKKDDKLEAKSPEAKGAEGGEDESPRRRKSDRKRKRDDNVLEGVELPDERKVKRGWTEPVKEKKYKKPTKDDKSKDKKKKVQASAYTDKEEMLFKTKLPLNIAEPQKSSKDKKKKKHKSDREVVVHEFENTTKHLSFLRSGKVVEDTNPVAEYDEKKGWVNEKGEVVESARSTRRKAALKTAPVPKVPEPAEPKPAEDDTSSSGSSSSEDESSGSPASPPSRSTPIPTLEPPTDNMTPSEGDAAPHPLETLFKKPKTPSSKPNLEVKIPFSFFGSDEPENEKDSSSIMTGVESARKTPAKLPSLNIPPQTPFTQRDMHWRGQRSAAPTPDTAAPSKLGFGNLWERRTSKSDSRSLDGDDEDEDDEGLEDVEEGEDSDEESKGKKGEEQSEFVKEFYKKRGDYNREWKKRKRVANKEKKLRENKRRSSRV